jgi:2-keto-4-pentenoate hydratase
MDRRFADHGPYVMTDLPTPDVYALAASLYAARTEGAALVASPARGPETDDEAYRVQDAITARLAAKVKAWKVGAADAVSTPNGAPIFDLYEAGAVPARASTGVELEIAFKLAKGFPAGGAKPSRSEVEAAIGSAHIALETCASRLVEGLAAPGHLRLADFGTNLGLVIGPEVPGWRTIDAKTLRAQVTADGATIADVKGGHTAPDLLGLLHWIVGHAVSKRGGMEAGTVVTTGSWMGIRWVDTPAKIVGTFDGLGQIEVQLTR